MMSGSTETKIECYHCGDDCDDDSIKLTDKFFCCEGCKLVYEILNENNLCSYYSLEKNPGIKAQLFPTNRFSFLDNDAIQKKLISFQKAEQTRVNLHIPSIHCSSCIWLLENFKKVDKGILESKVNFLTKNIHLTYDNTKTSLRKIVEGLTRTGYEPSIHLDSIEKKEKKTVSRSRILRIGVAGFCFGNIMMLSFPEYFASGIINDPGLKSFFSYLILLLSLPVFFYSASEFFIKSYQALKQHATTIDLPIALGIAAIFLRSSFEIIFHKGPGFFDSGSGLVFFMLVGRWFQDFTFDSLAFDRDYKSYFPLAVTVLKNKMEKIAVVNEIKINDKIIIRNNEIIPVDGTLLKGTALIDYSFVTGESLPVPISIGELIFAGGKQTGSVIEILVSKELSQSHLTELWNNNSVEPAESKFEILTKVISRYFIIATLLIAVFSGIYWWNINVSKAMNAFTAVLVIACPCALALSAPFTYGNILRILGKKKIFIRNYSVLQNMSDINTIVFDKTGTLTENSSAKIEYFGKNLTDDDLLMIFSLVRNSSHPLSRMLTKYISRKSFLEITDYKEHIGEGISGCINGIQIKAGSSSFISFDDIKEADRLTGIRISFDNKFIGSFIFRNKYRNGLNNLMQKFRLKQFQTYVLSGDNEGEKNALEKIFPERTAIYFNQSAFNKFQFIKELRRKGFNVMMIGDGLNDAGALRESNVGISISDGNNNFTPASDVIMDSSQFANLFKLISYSKSASNIIIISFIISLLYNFVGLSFAVTGLLSPVIAAVLMPISTISLVLFTVLASTIKGKMLDFRE